MARPRAKGQSVQPISQVEPSSTRFQVAPWSVLSNRPARFDVPQALVWTLTRNAVLPSRSHPTAPVMSPMPAPAVHVLPPSALAYTPPLPSLLPGPGSAEVVTSTCPGFTACVATSIATKGLPSGPFTIENVLPPSLLFQSSLAPGLNRS